MKRKIAAVWLAALVLILAGCGGRNTFSDGEKADKLPSSSASTSPDADWNGGGYWEMDAAESAPIEPDMPQEVPESDSIYHNPRAKLIRRAELNIQTEQFDQSDAALKRLVAECNGYFEMATLYGGSWRDANANRSGEYTVRVPAEKYDQFLHSTGDLGYITNKSENSEDVGERYYDTEARLKTQRTKQARLLALLEKAETMEDIILLESALSDVEYQIEQYSSELNRYDALIDFATFNIYLNEVNQVTQEVGETASLGARMAAGFQSSFQGLVQGGRDFLIWASYHIFLLAILVCVAAVAVVVGKRELKKLRKQEEKKPEED